MTTQTVNIALSGVISAWEATKPGDTTKTEIQRWLVEDMKPAIDVARLALAEPNEDESACPECGKPIAECEAGFLDQANTTVSDERLIAELRKDADILVAHAKKLPIWPGDNDYEDAAARIRLAADLLSARRATADVTEALRTKLEYMVKSYDALDDYDNGWRDACSEILAGLQKP